MSDENFRLVIRRDGWYTSGGRRRSRANPMRLIRVWRWSRPFSRLQMH